MSVGSGGTDGYRVHLADDVVDAGIGAVKVRIVAGVSGGVSALVDQGTAGISPWLFDMTDKSARVLGRAGVDLLTDAIGLAKDATLASIYARLSDGTVRVGGTVAVSGPVTDAQLRAAALPVSIAALPLPAGAATETTLATLATDAGLASVFARLGDGSQHVAVDSLPSGLATSAKQDTGNASLASLDGKIAACDTTGKATTALQTTGNTSVASIDAKTPALVSGRVPVDGSGATQPISAVALPLPAGASTEVTLAAIKAKTDNLDVALSTRAVTGLTDAQLRASPVPVSGPLTDAQLRASAVAISAAALPLPASASQEHTTAASPHATRLSDGAAFYDAAKTGQLPAALVGGRLDANNGAWLGSTAPTVGSKTSANSLPVVIASDQGSIPVAATCTGTVTANVGTTNGLALDATLTGGTTKAINRGGAKGATTAADLTGTAQGADHQALDVQIYHGGAAKDPTQVRALTAADVVTVTPPAITKGTQGATGFTTQDLKDAGRSRVSIVFQGVGAVADALLSLVKSTNGVAAVGATTIAVTAGKRLRITSMTFSVKANAAAAAFATFTLRINPSGAALISSQSEFRVDVGNTEAVVGAARAITIPLPDGPLEFSGTDQLAVSALAQATTNILSVSLNGFEF